MLFKSLQSIAGAKSSQKNQVSSLNKASSNQSNNGVALLDLDAIVIIPGLLFATADIHI